MMFDEYVPRGGWRRRHSMKKIREAAEQASLLLLLFAIYVAGCNLSYPF